MKLHILKLIVLLPILLSGCTILGAVLGSEVDKHTNESKYSDKYAGIGLDTDIEIVKQLLLPKEEPDKNVYTGVCKDDSEVNICSQSKGGCWCEKRPVISENIPSKI